MLAMFQIPNKFHERDGRVTDLSGRGVEGLSLSPSASGVGASRIERSRVAAWWNGRHSRLKICFWETGVPARVRPRPPFGAKNAGPGCIREFKSSATVPFKPFPTWPSGKEFSKILVGFWRHSLVAVAHRSGNKKGPALLVGETGPARPAGGGGTVGSSGRTLGHRTLRRFQRQRDIRSAHPIRRAQNDPRRTQQLRLFASIDQGRLVLQRGAAQQSGARRL